MLKSSLIFLTKSDMASTNTLQKMTAWVFPSIKKTTFMLKACKLWILNWCDYSQHIKSYYYQKIERKKEKKRHRTSRNTKNTVCISTTGFWYMLVSRAEHSHCDGPVPLEDECSTRFWVTSRKNFKAPNNAHLKLHLSYHFNPKWLHLVPYY